MGLRLRVGAGIGAGVRVVLALVLVLVLGSGSEITLAPGLCLGLAFSAALSIWGQKGRD